MQFIKCYLLAGLLFFSVLFSGLSQAYTLSASSVSSIQTLGTDTQSLFNLFLPVVILGVTLVVVIRLIKRFSSKV